MMISLCTQMLAVPSIPIRGHLNLKASPKRASRSEKTHSLPQEKIEVFKSLENWALQSVLPLSKPVEESWQPHDFLPDSSLSSDEFTDQVKALRERTKDLPDDYLVVLVGDMITEEQLPVFLTWINKHDGIGDKTGSSNTPWSIWSRSWAAEENRHGDLLKSYIYLSGRVDMLMIEKTIQYMIRAGMDLGTQNNPYMGFVYTSFQERAAFVSHGNTARLAKERGDLVLAKICGTIAADEKRHENAYVRIVEKLLEVDPTEAMVAIANVIRRNIVMPGHMMHDGNDLNLFHHFAAVAQRIGVYTAGDYADILEFLVGRWRLEKLEDLRGEGKQAQDYVCGLAPRIRRLQERVDHRARQTTDLKFSWIFNKELSF